MDKINKIVGGSKVNNMVYRIHRNAIVTDHDEFMDAVYSDYCYQYHGVQNHDIKADKRYQMVNYRNFKTEKR